MKWINEPKNSNSEIDFNNGVESSSPYCFCDNLCLFFVD